LLPLTSPHLLLNKFPLPIDAITSEMYLFDLFADFSRPFRYAPPPIDDSGDEAVSYTLFMVVHAKC
jgi:hypothetical protein